MGGKSENSGPGKEMMVASSRGEQKVGEKWVDLGRNIKLI